MNVPIYFVTTMLIGFYSSNFRCSGKYVKYIKKATIVLQKWNIYLHFYIKIWLAEIYLLIFFQFPSLWACVVAMTNVFHPVYLNFFLSRTLDEISFSRK